MSNGLKGNNNRLKKIMKKIFIFICIMSLFTIGAKQQEKFPEAEITNGIIRAHFYLPDSKNGYYQATRFDWSGNITSLEYKGHNYYGKWFEKYSPTIHDVVMGPVEEFDQVGYSEAKIGGSFIKIGVGALSKPEESVYNKFKLYQIVNHGKWKVRKKSDQIQFTHNLNDTEYSYEYSKTVRLTKGKPEMVLTHTLKNTGRRTIETDVYNHNFLVIDKQPTGPGYVVKFPFTITGTCRGMGDMAIIQGNQITFLRDLAKSENFFCNGLQGFSNTTNDYDIRVENIKAGAGVRITSDQPIFKMVFWSSSTTVCPEPYIKIKVEPGQMFSWKIIYEYYTLNP
jgi:hypothetical protein